VAIAGAIVGGVWQIAFASYTSFYEGVGIAIAVKAEIDSLLAIVEMREDLPELNQDATVLETLEGPATRQHIYYARVEQDYFGVFHAIRPKIGLLGDASGTTIQTYVFAKSFL
jgi:hypothetical protein